MGYYSVCYLELAYKPVRELSLEELMKHPCVYNTYRKMDNHWLGENRSFVFIFKLFFLTERQNWENSYIRDFVIHKTNETIEKGVAKYLHERASLFLYDWNGIYLQTEVTFL